MIGTVLANYDDGDKGVYVHENAKSEADVKKDYDAKKNTSAGGEKIGEIGGKINVNKVFSNLLNKNIKEAKSIYNPLTFRNHVRRKFFIFSFAVNRYSTSFFDSFGTVLFS